MLVQNTTPVSVASRLISGCQRLHLLRRREPEARLGLMFTCNKCGEAPTRLGARVQHDGSGHAKKLHLGMQYRFVMCSGLTCAGSWRFIWWVPVLE